MARARYGTLTPWQQDPAAYGQAVLVGRYASSEAAVVTMLRDLLERRLEYARKDGELFFEAAQNARVVANAERYYRAMYYGSATSWNLRDTHMFDTLLSLLAVHGPASRGIVWEHNSHVGNAMATEMSARGELNVGQLCRTKFDEGVYVIGFGTDHGTVAAASNWDEPMQRMRVRPAYPQSYERLFLEMDEVPFKPQAHEKAAYSVAAIDRPLATIYAQGGEKALAALPGIGKGIAERIAGLLQTGKIVDLEALRKKTPVDVLDLTAASGIGPRTARALWQALEVRTLAELKRAAKQGRLRTLPHFGERSEQKILEAITFHEEAAGRRPLGEVLPIGKRLEAGLAFAAVVQACLRTGTILEVDSQPERLDLPDSLVRTAIQAGVRIAIDSDAHTVDELRFIGIFGVNVARRGWADRAHVINTLPVDEMRAALKARRSTSVTKRAGSIHR